MVIGVWRAFFHNKTIQLSALIALATVAVYFNVTGFDFVAWDDVIHVYGNKFFEPVSACHLQHFWLRPYESLYIPVAYMAFGALCILARLRHPEQRLSEYETNLNPHVFHDANLLLHLVNALLVFLLIRNVVKAQVPAAFGALLFALHPLQVESVAWISELRGLLSCTLGLMAVLAYQSRRDTKAVWTAKSDVAAIALYALALLTKPSVVALPLVLLFWEVGFRQEHARMTLLRLAPWFALALIDVGETHAIQPIAASIVVPLRERFVVMGDSLGFYIQKLLWPSQLSIEYGRSPHNVIRHSLELWTIPIFLVAVATVFVLAKRRTWVVGCALTFLLFLIPNCGIVPFAYQMFSTVADRYAYLAMLGPAFALAFTLRELGVKSLRTIAYCLAGIWLCVVSLVTVRQVSTWKNTTTLFTNAIAVNSDDWLPHYKIGDECFRRSQWSQAAGEYQTVLMNGPRDPNFSLKLGQCFQHENRLNQAVTEFNKALQIDPKLGQAYYSRAICEGLLGDSDLAISDYRKAIPILPQSSYADYDLASELGAVGRLSEAAPEFYRTIQLHPDYMSAYYYLAMTYAKIGKPKLAEDVANMAVVRDPGDMQVRPYLLLTTGTTNSPAPLAL
jgi:tetratricopeptide (TPR) repeat protein